MSRLFILRFLFSWWVILMGYVLLVPIFYLLSGDLKGEVKNMNGFACFMWYGC